MEQVGRGYLILCPTRMWYTNLYDRFFISYTKSNLFLVIFKCIWYLFLNDSFSLGKKYWNVFVFQQVSG